MAAKEQTTRGEDGLQGCSVQTECRQSKDKKGPLRRQLRKDKKNIGKNVLRVEQGKGSFK